MSWSFGPCHARPRQSELWDTPSVPDDDLMHAHDFIEFSNRRLGGNRIVLNAMEGFISRVSPDMPVSVLDIRCGRGAGARQLAAWAREKKIDMRILAADPNPRLIKTARDRNRDFPEIVFETRDFNDPLFLQAQQFDFVVSALSLHQHPLADAITQLKIINRLTKRGFVVTDWVRDFRAWIWVSILARMWGEPIIRNDGPLAVRQGFTEEEVKVMAKKAGLETAAVKLNFGYRFSIVHERGLAFATEMSPLTGLAGA